MCIDLQVDELLARWGDRGGKNNDANGWVRSKNKIKWQKSRTLYNFEKCKRVSQAIIEKQMMHVYELLVRRSYG